MTTKIQRGLIRQTEESKRGLLFLAMLKSAGLPHPHQEYRFHDTRRWRFDYAWPQPSVALEVNGGLWTRGRHSRGVGQLKDFEKLNTAQLMGWRVLQVSPQQLCTPETIAMLTKCFSTEA